MSWGEFICNVRGQGDLQPDIAHICHPAAHMLSQFQKSGTLAVLEIE